MTAFNRTFGIEIECFLPQGMTRSVATAAIAQRLGQPCMEEGYNHLRRSHWKIVTDGSLGDYARGMELVSPPLAGEGGLDLVGRACEALVDLGATVNTQCGFHVHVGISDQNPIPLFKNLLKVYAAFEPVIDGMMPASRRGSTSMYCRSVSTVNLARLDAATDLGGVVGAIGSNTADRFRKLNLTAYARHRTVEFRQHSGTLDANKARKWTTLCLRMVAAAAAGKVPMAAVEAATQPSQNRARRGSKSWQIGEMLMRPDGVTGPEVCAALGWPSVSIPQQAAICGLQFRTERIGRTVRYYAVGIEAAAPVAGEAQPGTPLTIDGLAGLIEATEEERAYMARRTQDLSGNAPWNQ